MNDVRRVPFGGDNQSSRCKIPDNDSDGDVVLHTLLELVLKVRVERTPSLFQRDAQTS